MEAFARRFRCVCLDMDGTLCTNARHPDGHDRVTPHTIAALREFKASGGTVVVATGRPAAAATSVVDRDLPGVASFVVCCDGGAVLAPAAEAGGGWAPVWQSGLSGLAAARLLAAVAAQLPGCSFGAQLHSRGYDGFGVFGSVATAGLRQTLEEANPDSYISPKSLEAMVENGHRTAEDMARRSPTEVTPEQLMEQLEGESAVGWVRIVADADVEPAALEAQLQPLLDAENAEHAGSNATFMSPGLAGPTCVFRQAGTDKAVALAAVVEMLGITAADCCAFGDGDNDLGMFRWAGWSVCPSNAMPEAEELAATISTLSNNDDFIAEFFTRPTPSNTDESKVLPYTLPDPLRCDDGSRVTTAAEWPNRREEILEVFRSQVTFQNGTPESSPVNFAHLLARRSTAEPLSR